MNFSGIKAKLRVELAHGNLLDAHLGDWVNQAIRDILKEDAFKHLCASSTVSSTASQRTITRPTTAGSIIAVWYKDTTVVDTQPTHQLWRVQTRQDVRSLFDEVNESIPTHFFEDENGDIELWPIPDAVYSFIIDYTAFPVELSSDSDTNHLTEEWPYAVIYRAKWYGANSVDDEGLAVRALGQWREQMPRLTRFETQDMYGPMEEIPWSTDTLPRRWAT